jgi:hypothetical protein
MLMRHRVKRGVWSLGFLTSGVKNRGATNLPHLKGISHSRFRLGLRKGKGIPSSLNHHFPKLPLLHLLCSTGPYRAILPSSGSFKRLSQESSLAFLGTTDLSESRLTLSQCGSLALSSISRAGIHETH